MATRTATIGFVQNKLKDTQTNKLLTDGEVGERIDQAVLTYSDDVPRVVSTMYAGRAQQYYQLPSTYLNDYSSVNRIEYPIGGNPRTFINQNDFEIVGASTNVFTASGTATETTITLATESENIFFTVGKPIYITDGTNTEYFYVTAISGDELTISSALVNSYSSDSVYLDRYLQLIADSPSTSQVFSFEHTTPHSLSDSVDTIPTNHFPALVALAAAYCCNSIAANFGQSTNGSFTADVVDNVTKVTEWSNLAEQFMEEYNQAIRNTEVTAASATFDLDTHMSSGRSLIFHHRLRS